MAAAQGGTQRTAWLRGGTRGALGGVPGTPVPHLALTSVKDGVRRTALERVGRQLDFEGGLGPA